MNKLKIAGILLAVLAATGVGYKLAPSPVAQTKTVFVDKVVYQDRIVTKDVVRTETRPDGTKIVTETKVAAKETVQTKEVRKESVVTKPNLSKYSLGVSLRPESLYPFKGIYEVEIGRRVSDLPLFVTASVNSKREWTVGLRVEW